MVAAVGAVGMSTKGNPLGWAQGMNVAKGMTAVQVFRGKKPPEGINRDGGGFLGGERRDSSRERG